MIVMKMKEMGTDWDWEEDCDEDQHEHGEVDDDGADIPYFDFPSRKNKWNVALGV
jgi:hypothetical protein